MVSASPGKLMLEVYNKDPGSLDGFWYSLPLSKGNREGCVPKKTQILLPCPPPAHDRTPFLTPAPATLLFTPKPRGGGCTVWGPDCLGSNPGFSIDSLCDHGQVS